MRKFVLSMVLAVTGMMSVAPAVEPVLDEAAKMSILLPYATVPKEIVDTVGKGRIDDGVELLASHSWRTFDEEKRKKLRRAYSAMYGVAGVYDGNDLVAVRKYSPRAHKAYLIAYHREGLVLHSYKLFHRDGQWHVMGMSLDDDLDDLDASAPVVYLAPQPQLALRPSARN